MNVSIIYRKIAFASLLLLAGCTKVDLVDESEILRKGDFAVKYEWGSYASEVAQSNPLIHLVMARILNTEHNIFLTNAKGEFLTKKEEEQTVPEPEAFAVGVEEVPTEPTFDYSKSIYIPGGEYVMMAFTEPTDEKNVEVLNRSEFENNNTVSISEIAMKHVDTKASEVVVGKSWEDLNPGYKYVKALGDERLYVGRSEYLRLNVGQNYTHPFVFESLLQHVEVNFAIYFERDEEGDIIDVTPENIFAELSGIVPQVSLSNGILNTSTTKRMIVNAKEKSRETTSEGVVVYYNASYRTFGLIGGMDKQTISGPGIFRLGIYLEHGSRKKTVRVLSNLSEKIDQLGLTEMTAQVNERKKLKNEAVINIEARVVIKVAAMDSNSNDGISGWKTEGSVNAEV